MAYYNWKVMVYPEKSHYGTQKQIGLLKDRPLGSLFCQQIYLARDQKNKLGGTKYSS